MYKHLPVVDVDAMNVKPESMAATLYIAQKWIVHFIAGSKSVNVKAVLNGTPINS